MDGAAALMTLIFGAFAIFFIGEFIIWVFPYILWGAAIAAGGGLLCLIIAQGPAIARWYYFTFDPHPAEPVVRSALAQGRLLDGNRLAAALGEVPPNNRILQEVRIAQSERLVAEMQQASESTIRESLKAARSDQERAAYVGIQEAIALAAAALERAKAAHAASKSP